MIVLCGAMAACTPPPVTVAHLAGTYESNLDCGVETLFLRADGAYSMEFVSPSGKQRSNQGRWKIGGGGERIEFDGFIFGYRTTEECPHIKSGE